MKNMKAKEQTQKKQQQQQKQQQQNSEKTFPNPGLDKHLTPYIQLLALHLK